MKGMWKKHLSVAVTFAFAPILAGGIASAQEPVVENDTGVGARAMGMGEAQIAASNDLSALIHNPAALARIEKLEVQFGLNMLKRKMTTTLSSTRGSGKADESTDYSSIGSAGLAYPLPTEQGSLVFAVGYNRVKDFAGRLGIDGYNDDLRGWQTGELIEEGGVGILSLGGAVDVSPNLSFGLSLDFWFGEYQRDNRSLLNDSDEGYSQLDLNGADDDISAWSLKPGVLYFKDKFRFGAFARLPMTFHIDESFYSEGYSRDDAEYFNLYENIDPSSPFNDADYTYVDHLKYTIKTPMQFGFGVAYGTPGVRQIAFDLVYQNWSQAKLRYPSDYAPEPNYFRDKYRSSVQWRFGLEHKLPFLGLVGRAGYIRDPLTFKGPRGYEFDARSIVTTNEREYLTLGLGKRFDDSLNLDVAVVKGLWARIGYSGGPTVRTLSARLP